MIFDCSLFKNEILENWIRNLKFYEINFFFNQAVNTINTVASRQVKTQDVVPGPTLIYTTTNRAQGSQIVIQRAVGRVNAPTISQVIAA